MPTPQHAAPQKRRLAEGVLLGALCLFFYFSCGHDDLLETSNHAWLLLDCLGKGQFRQFYEVVMAHENTLYYLNNAHYNILCYLLYAVWQLPVRLACALAGTAANEYFLMFWSKGLGTLAFGGCALLLRRLAVALGYPQGDARLAALGFVLHPIAFFAALIMGQYDTLCLFFLLAALLAWCQGRYWRFALLGGAAMVFKFFPLLLLLPLVALAEKRLHRCCGLLAASLWLVLPTGLLFRGHTGDMGVFNELMIQRIFAAALPGGLDAVPAFLFLYALLLFGCYLYRPATEADRLRWLPWLGLAVFGLLFLLTAWHPQWLILLAPFLVLTTLAQKQRAPWFLLEGVFFFGYWLCANLNYPAQLEGNLFRFGWLGPLISAHTAAGPHNSLAFYIGLVPWLAELSPVIFAAPLAAMLLFKLPWQGRTPAQRLAGQAAADPPALTTRRMIWGLFAVCILVLWLGSAAFVLFKAFG